MEPDMNDSQCGLKAAMAIFGSEQWWVSPPEEWLLRDLAKQDGMNYFQFLTLVANHLYDTEAKRMCGYSATMRKGSFLARYWVRKPEWAGTIDRNYRGDPRIPERLRIATGQIVRLQRDIWIGNHEACKSYDEYFDRVIHIHHQSQRGECPSVGITTLANDRDLVLDYKEHDPLSPEILDAIYRHAFKPGRLLIHCAAGLGRSPTLALVCLWARGEDRYQAMSHIAERMWAGYQQPHLPCWDGKRLNEIWKFLDNAETDEAFRATRIYGGREP